MSMELHSSMRCGQCGESVQFWCGVEVNRYMSEDLVVEGRHPGVPEVMYGRMLFYIGSPHEEIEIWELARFMCARMAAALDLTECGDWWKSLSKKIEEDAEVTK